MYRLAVSFPFLVRDQLRPSAYFPSCRGLAIAAGFQASSKTGESRISNSKPVVSDLNRIHDGRETCRGAPGRGPPLRVGMLIVGAGVTGLTAAYELQCMYKQGHRLPSPPKPPPGTPIAFSETTDTALPFLVAEAASQVGGCLETQRSKCGAFLWDTGANSFRLTAEMRELLQKLALNEELVTVPQDALRFAAVDGGLLPLPHSLPSLLESRILSWSGKARLALGVLFGARPWLPLSLSLNVFRGGKRPEMQQPDAPSISTYISSVLGSEVERKVVGALVTGIYAGDPASLSMRLALPALKDMLDRGLLRALVACGARRIRYLFQTFFCSVSDDKATQETTERQQQPSIRQDSTAGAGARGPSIGNFRGGMQTLATGLAGALPPGSVHLKTELISLVPLSETGKADGFLATFSTPQGDRQIMARHVLLTLSPVQTAQILGEGDKRTGGASLLGPAAVQQLQNLPFASLAMVTVAIRPACARSSEKSTGLTPNGFGFLVSPFEAKKFGWQSLGGICVSRIFSGRAPNGSELFTAFVGGSRAPTAIKKTDQQLVERVIRDLLKAGVRTPESLLPEPEDQSSSQHSSQEEKTNRDVYYYKVLGVRRWPHVVAQFGLQHSTALELINKELLQQQKQRFPNCHLLLEGGWVSGIAVGDRVLAGQEAARILVQGEHTGRGNAGDPGGCG